MKKWDKGRKQTPDDEETDKLDYEEENYDDLDYEELDFDEAEEWRDSSISDGYGGGRQSPVHGERNRGQQTAAVQDEHSGGRRSPVKSSEHAGGRKPGGRDDRAWQDEEEPEEEDGLSPWVKVALFLGLMILAAIICAALWYFTHSNKPEEDGPGSFAEGEAGGENGQLSEPAETHEQNSTGLSDEGGKSDPAGDLNAGQVSDSAGDPEAGQPSNSDNGADQEKPSGGDAGAGTGTDAVTSPEAEGRPEPSGNGSEEVADGENKEPVQGTGTMEFRAVEESVTPKDVVNLRSVPTTGDDGNIVIQAENGEVLKRVGLNGDTGWSKIEYNGETVYAVTQYLTTDLNYKTPMQPSNPNRVNTIDGRVIIFADCDDWVSPKEYVNLRTEPSTSEGNDTVSCQMQYGEKAHRTGYSPDSGWSRVEYNGQTLYVVTSLVYVVTEE